MVLEGVEERGDRGQECRHQNTLFYADNDMVSSSDPQWVQGVFSNLVGLFDKLVLNTNFGKTVGMVCCPCQSAVTQLEVAYR